MRHDPKFATFHGAYLNERVEFDLQNTFLGEETENQMYRLLAHVSLTRDPRATRDMVPKEVWANLPPDPEIAELEERRAELKRGQYRIRGREAEAEIRSLTETIGSRRAQRDAIIVKQYHKYYFYNRPTWDIEKQACGEEEKEHVESSINLDIPERARLAEIWCDQPDDWTDEETYQQRVEAIDLMASLCNKRETAKRRDRICPQTQTQARLQQSAEPSPGHEHFPLLMDANQCPDCIGDKRISYEQRTFQYCRSTVRNDHFDNQHLKEREEAEQRGEPIRCKHPKCKEQKFQHLDHFRHHVYSVHRVQLRSSAQVRAARSKKTHRQAGTQTEAAELKAARPHL